MTYAKAQASTILVKAFKQETLSELISAAKPQ